MTPTLPTRRLKLDAAMGFKVLILEDDADLAETLVTAIDTVNGEAVVAGTIDRAKSLVAEKEFDLCLLDYCLPDGKGSSFFSYLREQGSTAPCIMLTGQPEIPVAVELTRNGLFDYLTKPFKVQKVLDSVQRAAAFSNASLTSLHHHGLVDTSPAMKTVRRQIRQAALNPQAAILIGGETGVGKDLVAHLIHQLTFEAADTPPPIVSLNCSTLPGDMFEAELFGTMKGAYTGAYQHRAGLAESANGGTLFLDEIAEVPLPLQAKLLHFLETRQFRRLGSTEVLYFTGRIIAATNKPLDAEVQAGRFRSDLLYRLDVLNIHIPPLRERKEEIAPLVQFLLDGLCQKYERLHPIPRQKDLDALLDYDFPGNVRELRNLVERSLLHTPVDSSWLEMDLTGLRRTKPVAPTPTASGRTLNPIEEQEYRLIQKTLVEERGFIRRAAAKLGMSHQALLRRLTKWPELRVA